VPWPAARAVAGVHTQRDRVLLGAARHTAATAPLPCHPAL